MHLSSYFLHLLSAAAAGVSSTKRAATNRNNAVAVAAAAASPVRGSYGQQQEVEGTSTAQDARQQEQVEDSPVQHIPGGLVAVGPVDPDIEMINRVRDD